jgi:hypothetical protein
MIHLFRMLMAIDDGEQEKKINWSKRRINNRKRDGLSNYL